MKNQSSKIPQIPKFTRRDDEIFDTVKTFSEHTKIGADKVRQYCRGYGFPKIQTTKRGRIIIRHYAALEWLEWITTVNNDWYLSFGVR